MKITILTYGSRGDVQPFLALAVGLQKAGHAITLAAPARFQPLAAPYPITYAPLPGDPEELSRGFNDAGMNLFRQVMAMRDHAVAIAPQVVEQTLRASQNAQLLIHSFTFTVGAHTLARQLGIPDLSIQPFPIFAPTRAYPAVGFPNLGAWGNYLSHQFADWVFFHAGNVGFRQVQHLLPAAFPRTLRWPFANPEEKLRTPLLFAVSPSVLPPASDWPKNVSSVGYFFLDEPSYQPPAPLMEFLRAGPPPIVLGFGSMVHKNAAHTGQTIMEAIAQANQRAIVLTGWGGWVPSTPPKNILYIESAPHSWLLPRAAAFVHHGGAGATAAGLRAGIPSIVVPHTADQPFWGQRVHQLNAGSAPIPIHQLNTARLVEAIRQTQNDSIIQSAHLIASKIAAEDSIQAVLRYI